MSLSLRLQRVRAKLVGALLLSSAMACVAQATNLDFTPKLTQFNHRAWRVKDGSLPGSPQVIAQTPDGYLWVGTDAGLVRFNGVGFTSIGSQDLTITSLLASRDGRLWVGTTQGLMRLKGDHLDPIPHTAGLISDLAEDNKGHIWLARMWVGADARALCDVSREQSRCYGPGEGLACSVAQTVLAQPDGSIWVGSGQQFCRLGDSSHFAVPGGDERGAPTTVSATAISGAGSTLLVTLLESKTGAYLQEFRDGRWFPVSAPGLETARGLGPLIRASDGSVWAGSPQTGLYHIHNGQADHLGTADGLSGDAVASIFQDREGSIWVASADGLDQLRAPKVVTFSTREGLLSDPVSSVITTAQGDVWAGQSGGFFRMHDGKVTNWTPKTGLPGHVVTTLLQDRQGTLWLGLDNSVARFEAGHFQVLSAAPELLAGVIGFIFQDTDGTIWVKTLFSHPRLLRVTSSMTLEEVTLPNGEFAAVACPDFNGGVWVTSQQHKLYHVRSGQVTLVAMLPKNGGGNRVFADAHSVYVASSVGLLRWDGKSLSRLTTENGLPCDVVYDVAKTTSGNLWLALRCGNYFLPQNQLAAWEQNSGTLVHGKFFSPADGVRTVDGTVLPSLAIGTNDRAWFATGSGLQMVDLSNQPASHVPPPVHITAFQADGKDFGLTPGLRLAPLTRTFRIAYDGLSFVTPEKVDYKYRLTGVDRDWQDAGSRREAFYMNLPPGSYVFKVIARNSDGVWNSAGDTYDFILRPAFYQTTWFFVLMMTVAALAIFIFIHMRIRRGVTLLNARYRERLAERDRIARELHDTLLQGFQMLLLRMHTGVQLISSDEPARPVLEEALDRAERVLADGRNSVQDLRRESSHGQTLAGELERNIREYRSENSPACTLHTLGAARDLNSDAQEEILAIGREAMVNALKHAEAKNIRLELRYERRWFTLICTDDGRGMNAAIQQRARVAGHFGLVGMRERATKMGARLTVHPGTSGGTAVELRVPAPIAYRRTPRFRTFLKARSDAA